MNEQRVPFGINALDKIEEKVKSDQSFAAARTKGGKTVSKLED